MSERADGSSELKWWQRPLRIAAQQCEVDDDPMQVVQKWANMGFNVEQLLHISAQGWLGRFNPEHSTRVKNYMAKAHSLGLHVIFYYGGHWLDSTTAEVNPTWRACRKDGTPMNHACLGNPGYQEWAEKLIQGSLALGADGIFLDGAYVAAAGCYCERCQDEFKQMFDRDMLAEENAQQRRHLTEHRMRVVEGYLARLESAVHTQNPDAVFYVNMPGTNPLRSRGVDMRRHLVYQDFIGVEGGFVYYQPAQGIPQWKAGAAAKLMEAVGGGKPAVTFCAADHKPWNLYHITGPEATITYCEAIANGSNVWFGLHTPRFREAVQTPAMRAVARMNFFTAKNEKYYTSTASCARVAVLFSFDTAEEYHYNATDSDFTAAQKGGVCGVVGDFRRSWMGCYEALLRSHIQFDLIDDTVITDTPQLHTKYDLVILPTVACMSDKLAAALERFVEVGGNILATHDTGAFDELGTRRSAPVLSAVLGVDYQGKPVAMKRFSYMSLTENDGKVMQGTSQALLPAPEWAWEIATSNAEVLAWYHTAQSGQYRPLGETTTPVITRHRIGKGTAVYIAGTWFESYYTDRIPDHRIVTENLVRMLSHSLVNIQGAPSSVEVICRQQPGERRLMIHLINLTGDMNRPMENVVPIAGPIKLTFSSKVWSSHIWPDKPLIATALMAGKSLLVHELDDQVEITLPGINDYEVVVLEQDS